MPKCGKGLYLDKTKTHLQLAGLRASQLLFYRGEGTLQQDHTVTAPKAAGAQDLSPRGHWPGVAQAWLAGLACALAVVVVPLSSARAQDCTPQQNERIEAAYKGIPLAESEGSCEELAGMQEGVESLEGFLSAYWPPEGYCRQIFESLHPQVRAALPVLRARVHGCNQIAVELKLAFLKDSKPQHVSAVLLDALRFDPASTWPAPPELPSVQPGNHELAVCTTDSQKDTIRVAVGEVELAKLRDAGGETGCARFRFEAKPGESLQLVATVEREAPPAPPKPAQYELRLTVSEQATLDTKQVARLQKSLQAELNGEAVELEKPFVLEQPATLRLDYPANQGRRWYVVVAQLDEQPLAVQGPAEPATSREALRRSERYVVPFEPGVEKLLRLELDSDKHPSRLRSVLIRVGQGLAAVGVVAASYGLLEDESAIATGGVVVAVVGAGAWLGASAMDEGREPPERKRGNAGLSVGWSGTF